MRLACLAILSGLLLGLTGPALAGDKPAKKKRILVITESKGFVHSVVNRKGQPQCMVEQVLTDLGNKTGIWEAVCSQDSKKEITAENLKNFDAVFFYTTGTLPLSEQQKADLLAFVRSGKGFAGSHCATDTFYGWKEYGEMIGAYFDGHPWHTKINVIVEDKKHPATRHLGDSFVITDEIYQFRTPYSRDNLRILMRMDPGFAKKTREESLKQVESQKKKLIDEAVKLENDGKATEAKKLRAKADGLKPGIRRDDLDHALAWVREYGKGRVFYTALGHREEVWQDERFQQHIIGGFRWILGLEEAVATPSRIIPRSTDVKKD